MITLLRRILPALLLCTAAFGQVSINGYDNAVITQTTSDPRGIASLLTVYVQKSGMHVVSSSTLGEDAALRTCVIEWSQYGELTQYCQITVKDLLSGTTVAQSMKGCRMRVGIPACIRGSVDNAWKALKYRGFDTKAHETNLSTLFPKRPTVAATEEAIKSMPLADPIEGIWTDSDNRYTIGIVRDQSQKYGDFVGVVLRSSLPIWAPGEIKMELRSASVPGAYTANVYIANKSRVGTSVLAENGGTTMHFDLARPDGSTARQLWVKNYPKLIPNESNSGHPTATSVSWTGSGFLISGSGLVATNNHVASGASSLKVLFPTAGKEFVARVVLKDPNNDLAILQLDGFSLEALHQSAISYGFRRTRSVALGDPVFTIGFPLSSMLGENPKFTNGTISSKSGLGDDMVHLQINAPIQPGSSGSPVFDAQGNVIGVAVATLNPEATKGIGAIPQNVNFAVKSDYLVNLTEMLPTSLKLDEIPGKVSPDQIVPFVCLIRAQ